MKQLIVMLGVAGIATASLAEPRIGMRFVPPSERGYAVQAIRESGERGGLLMTIGTNFTAADNREMGEAMELWNAHHWPEAVTAMEGIWRAHPESPWAAEAEMHQACYLKFNGRFDEAEERFVSLLQKYPDNASVRGKVLRYLPHLYAESGRLQAALDTHLQMQNLPLTWQERQHLENYSRIFGQALLKEEADRLCGTKALALTLAAQNEKGEKLRNVSMAAVYKRFAWSRRETSDAAGYSLQELAEMSGGSPVQTDLETLRQAAQPGHPVLVYLKTPAEPKCFAILNQPVRQDEKSLTGHFLVVERVGDASVDVLDPDGGRFRWTLPHFVYRWSGVALVLPGQKNLPGRSLGRELAAQMRGGCCGSPPPPPGDDDCSDPNGGGESCPACGGNDDGECCEGAPGYSFGLNSANFRLNDTPIWSPGAKGPTLKAKLKYSRVETQRMGQYSGVNVYISGNKWHFNYASHVTETPNGGAEIVLPGGRVERFNQAGGVYEPADTWNRNSLFRSNEWFVLTFHSSKDQWFYSTNTALQQRLEKLADKYGNTVTLQYDEGTRQLTNMVDAVGRCFRYEYNAQGYITNITDSIGRNAAYTYNAYGDLLSLTDMGGLTTAIQYNENHWPTNITYPSGYSWRVEYAQGAWNYTQPFSMNVFDPLGQVNSYQYCAYSYMGPITQRDKAGNTWLYAQNTVGDGSTRRTYYRAVNGHAQPYAGTGDQWQHTEYDADANPVRIATANTNFSTSIGYAVGEGAWVEDVLTTNLFDANHNLLCRAILTNNGSSLRLVGTWTNGYDARDNRIITRNALNQVTRYAYNDNDQLIATTNALNQVTQMAYDHNGNMTNLLDALNHATSWLYDNNGRQYRSIHADGSSNSLGYDIIGRLNAVTNHSSGLHLQYTHDNLDRMTDVTFPDGTVNHFEYSCCGLDWTRDRLNRTTYYDRDALGRTTQVTDPQNRMTGFRYNGADQITNLITYAGSQQRVKRFDYTSTNGFNRLTRVATPTGKLTRYDYTFRGGLSWRQDGNGYVTKYQYDLLERLTSVTDSNNNALLKMDYNVLNNVTAVSSFGEASSTSPISVFNYQYDALNRATNVVCMLTNIPGFVTVQYRIDYQFDAMGNVTNRLLTGLQGFADTILTRYVYDAMNRLTVVSQIANSYKTAHAVYQYDGAGRLHEKTYGNNDVVTYAYDLESRLLSLGITNGTSPVTTYTYGWDVGGNILAITNNGNVTFYQYDAAGQLTNEISATVTNSWQYDAAGNWLNAGGGSKWVYNADNELLAKDSPDDTNWSVTVTGLVEPGPASNKWYRTKAECRGVEDRVDRTNGTFSLPDVPLYAGSNTLVVSVTDVSGNSTQQVRHVCKSLANCQEIFLYDGNGNVTNSVNGSQNWMYEWDWADRLTKVSSNGVVVLQNWYDANSRRIAKQEVVNGQTQKWIYLYDGWDIVGVMNENGQMRETFTRGVGLAGDIGTLVAVTHHAGSTTNGTFYIHHNHRGDVVLARSGTATVGSYSYSGFGILNSVSGPDICRFKFSSKERDVSTGWSYYGYRFYVPAWQRWPDHDPIEEDGGINLYSYVGNDPVNEFDPLGLAGYGNPVSGPNGPVGPSDPFSPGLFYPDGWQYKPVPSCMEKCLNDYPGLGLALGMTPLGLLNAKMPGEMRPGASSFTTIDRRLGYPLGKGGATVTRGSYRIVKRVGPLGTAAAAGTAAGAGYTAGAIAVCACKCRGKQ